MGRAAAWYGTALQLRTEFGLSHQQIAERVGRSRSRVTRALLAAGLAGKRSKRTVACVYCGRPTITVGRRTIIKVAVCQFHYRWRTAANMRRYYWAKRALGQRLLNELRTHGPGRIYELAAALEASNQAIRAALRRLAESGAVVDRVGVWSIKEL